MLAQGILDGGAAVKASFWIGAVVAVWLGGLAAQAQDAPADLLPVDMDWREIPFEVVDLKPLIAVAVNGKPGRMMLDNGTPEALFFNRDAAGLSPGDFVAQGAAASGQIITVHLHDAPMVQIAGLPVTTAQKVVSGDFGFTETMFGPDFFGFIGAPSVAPYAFTLDYGRNALTLLRTDADGALQVPAPPAADVVAEVAFSIWPGEQPTTAALLGDLPILMDVDTGDSGTIYLRPQTRAALLAAGAIREEGDALVLSNLRFGGATFADLAVQEVEADGPKDTRPSHHSDFLRLGAAFLSTHPTLWNFPAGTITVLRPESGFLAAR